MTIYHIPENEQKMDELYVVLSSDEKGEGIVSMTTPMGAFPMVFGHEKMLHSAKSVALKMAKETGKKLLIVKYTQREIIEEINP